MRMIFLNSWFAKTGEPYFDFIKSEAPKTDIFCFMEYSPELFDQVSKILTDFNGILEKGNYLKIFNIYDCQAIFARKEIKVVSSGRLDIYKNTENDTGCALYTVIEVNGKILHLMNVHGKSRPGDKNDTEERLKQSKIIIDFFKNKECSKIIGGDFNLNPDTKSVKMFEEVGYRNLIREFNIENTRNNTCWEQFKEDVKINGKQHFADYCFVSADVRVKSFEVPYNEVSDHLPLILDFEL
jgi:endonuclease/exonuclease/phosphatase family metal-dependent hydrolase